MGASVQIAINTLMDCSVQNPTCIERNAFDNLNDKETYNWQCKILLFLTLVPSIQHCPTMSNLRGVMLFEYCYVTLLI